MALHRKLALLLRTHTLSQSISLVVRAPVNTPWVTYFSQTIKLMQRPTECGLYWALARGPCCQLEIALASQSLRDAWWAVIWQPNVFLRFHVDMAACMWDQLLGKVYLTLLSLLGTRKWLDKFTVTARSEDCCHPRISGFNPVWQLCCDYINTATNTYYYPSLHNESVAKQRN